jgi:hypothetical protein
MAIRPRRRSADANAAGLLLIDPRTVAVCER